MEFNVTAAIVEFYNCLESLNFGIRYCYHYWRDFVQREGLESTKHKAKQLWIQKAKQNM